MQWTLFALGLAIFLTGSCQAIRGYGHRRNNIENFNNEGSYRMGHANMMFRNETSSEITASNSSVTGTLNVTTTSIPLSLNHTKVVNGSSTQLESEHNAQIEPLPKPKLKIKTPLVTVVYTTYKKNKPPVTAKFPKIKLDKISYFFIHGISDSQQAKYVSDFFAHISEALLEACGDKCNVVGVKWTVLYARGKNLEREIKGALAAGKMVGDVINILRRQTHNPLPINIIGHDLGNVVASGIAPAVKVPVESVMGLDQRVLPRTYRHQYLRKDMFGLVQTMQTQPFAFDYGHRNFFPNDGNIKNLDFDYGFVGSEGNCFKCHSYRLYSDDIMKRGKGHLASFCTSYEEYERQECVHLPTVSYFNNEHFCDLPEGKYFITETAADIDYW